ncbi:adenylyl-sulfate kinase [Rhodospirillales bacterium]|nr:adenylyl-sulfate kinase [Rhodospirillales bacterium]
MIIYITGLSSSGKTTVGRLVHKLWSSSIDNVLFIDGDEIRQILGQFSEHDTFKAEARHEVAWRYARLCKWLDSQGMHAVCCTISYFEDVREFNRNELSEYFEVFLDVSVETIVRRDKKNLYARGLKGEVKNIVGIDQLLEPPTNPHMHIMNDEDSDNLSDFAKEILSQAVPTIKKNSGD